MRQAVSWLNGNYRRAKFRARGIFVSAQASVECEPGCAINIMEQASVARGSLLIAAQDLKNKGPGGVINIGRRTAINEYCNLRASGSTIDIGENCMLAQFVTIVGSNHGTSLGTPMLDQPWDLSKTGVILENDVWIGANVIVLPGVKISTGAVVAAGAVVNSDIPCHEIWGGIPARKLRSRK